MLDFPQAPDAPVLDIGLLGMTGIEFGKLLTGLFPEVRLVFITGWPDRPEALTRPEGSVLLAKPFPLSSLLAALGAQADPAIANTAPSGS